MADKDTDQKVENNVKDNVNSASNDNTEQTPFEQAIKVWTAIDLITLQKVMDDQGLKIVENQTSSMVGRKELAEQTKAFRKLSDEAKLSEIKGLLKLYQTEIDSLTNRGKYAENCFMNVYKHLSEAPDPRPLLEASVDSVMAGSNLSELAAENARLNDLLSRYADYEAVKAKLLKVEMEAAGNVAARVAAKEAEMSAIMDEKERYWKLKEEELRQQMEELRANHEVTEAQLNVQSSRDPSDVSSRLAELELVASDLERANSRALQVEKRNLELRSELETLKSGARDASVKQELESQVNDLQGENAILAAKIESSRSLLAQTKAADEQKITALEREVGRRTQEIDSLKKKLDQQRDYDVLKRELDILKSIELKVDNEDGEDEQKNLEEMVLARNKKLNSDLATLRVQNGDLRADLDKAQHEVKQLNTELENLKELNNRLEEDLMTMRQGSAPHSTVAQSMVSGWTRTGRVSPTSSIINGNVGGNVSLEPTRGEKANDGILPIVTQQRDRFRARNNELEEELRKSWAVVSSLRKEIESVKKDNMDLYERTRYAASFKRSSNTSSVVESKYREAYEEGLTAFQQFKGRETERILSRMGPLERVAYSFSRVVLANRLSRNLFLFYCLGLHLFVMVMIMHMVDHGELEPRAASLASEPVKR